MRLSIVHKLSLASILLVLISASVTGALFYKRTTQLLVDHALEDIAKNVQEAGRILQRILSRQDEDVLFLANTPPVQGMLSTLLYKNVHNSSYFQWMERLETVFESQLLRKSAYLSLRFIDKQGQELVHVSRIGSRIIRYHGTKLQNKSSRVYVRETLDLPEGAIYVSKINLNREFGKLTNPHQEVIRSATPIYDKTNGELAGIIVVTTEIGNELRVIQDAVKGDGKSRIFITNDHGGYLLHAKKEKTYGFDLGKRYRIQEDLPQLAGLYLPENKDIQVTLMPEYTDGQQVINFTKIPVDSANPERFIAVVITQEYNSIVAEQTQLLNDVVKLALLLALVGASLGILISIRITRPIQQMTQFVDDFTHQRITNVKLPVDQGDEVGILARSFKSMTQQVNESQTQQRELNENLETLVTERTQSLEKSEAQQRTILETIADAIITIDNKGLIKSFNPAAEKIFGFKTDEVIDQNISILLPENGRVAHQNYIDDSQLYSPRIINQTRDLEGRRKDGTLFPLELNVAPMHGDGENGFVGTLRDITDRKRVDKMKNEFISTVSHELRTPLTSIRGSLGLITGGAVGKLPKQAQDMINIAGNNTERLLLLINDILDIQKIASGQMALKLQSLEVMPFIKQSLAENESYGKQNSVRFVIANELPGARIFADKNRMMQVMANLLSNAAKFSPKGDTVEVSIARHYGDSVRISVTDHGPGIADEFQSKIFEKFTQSDSSNTRKEGGTGLGLSISKALVEKHGGRIDYVSRVGIGATFYIELPEYVGDDQQAYGDIYRQLTDEKHSPCILIVEEDQDVAALMRRMLSEAGYNSDISNDANGARQILRENAVQYKAVIIDLMLPDNDGVGLLEDLRRDTTTHDIPVVVVSYKADEAKHNLKGGAIGVVDWLQKPIDKQRLIDAVTKASGSTRLPRVLHVEDDADVRKVVDEILQNIAELTWTSTFATSKERLETEEFDLVLLDIGLPDGSGLDLLETIEKCMMPPQVVIFSAYDVSDEYAGKVSEVLVKSKTDNVRLAEIIKRVINN